jgi:hypothetical protein
MENEIQINVDALCVLKFASNSELVMVDYETIPRPLDSDFEQLKTQFSLEYKDAKSILSYVKNHFRLKILLEKYDYCGKLNGSFQGINSDISAIESKYQSNFPNIAANEEVKKIEKETLLIDLQERLQAYYLESAYKICEQKRLQKFILAYSHRKVGWGTPKYELNPNFSIELKTNFGYGYVSYFYTRIKYKELDIIPYSDWILYEKAQLFEIIRYSSKHQLKNESWVEALEYSRDACNLSLTDEIAFVRKYVIDECERMVSGLEEFLEVEKFKFLNKEKISNDVHKEGHNLIEFRGEKLSGAINFIEKIIQFDKIAEIKEFVKRIEICNQKVQPMLTNEVMIIKQELIELNKILDVLKPLYENLEKRNTVYDTLKSKLRDKMIADKELTVFDRNNAELEKRFKGQNPEYEKFVPEYNEKKEQYLALTAQILSLETTMANIERYNKVIEIYFETISLQTDKQKNQA